MFVWNLNKFSLIDFKIIVSDLSWFFYVFSNLLWEAYMYILFSSNTDLNFSNNFCQTKSHEIKMTYVFQNQAKRDKRLVKFPYYSNNVISKWESLWSTRKREKKIATLEKLAALRQNISTRMNSLICHYHFHVLYLKW